MNDEAPAATTQLEEDQRTLDGDVTARRAAASEAKLEAIREERARLTALVADLEEDQRTLDGDVARQRSDAARAKLNGEALSAKANKARNETDREVEAVADALSDAKLQLQALEERERVETANLSWAQSIDEKEAISRALPKIADLLDQVIALAEGCSTPANHRALLFAGVSVALRDAVDASNRGMPGSVAPRLTELAAELSRDTNRGPARRQRDALPVDTPVYAKRGLSYADAGDRNMSRRELAAGTLAFVPRAVADAAVAGGVADIVKVRFLKFRVSRDFILETEAVRRIFTKGRWFEAQLDIVASLKAWGVLAEVSSEISDQDMRSLRPHYPEPFNPPFGVKDLGRFNEAIADGQRVFAELAGDAPKIPDKQDDRSARALGMAMAG